MRVIITGIVRDVITNMMHIAAINPRAKTIGTAASIIE